MNTKLRVLLVDADSAEGFSNLALMKISAWCKETMGIDVEVDLIKGIPHSPPIIDYDYVYISCIFFQNAERVREYASMIGGEVSIGGSGVDLKTTLSPAIEHIMPDYSLYNTDISMGFTSRGCIRKCPWCIVPEKEGYIKDHAPISEFLHPDHEKVIIHDNNFQASPRWRENLEFLISNDLKVNFGQGMDIRLIDSEFAEVLADVKYYDWHFKSRRLYFAFDTMGMEKAVLRGIDILNDAGIPSPHLMFYILVGHSTTLEEDLHRVDVLHKLGARPYIMVFNRSKDPDLLRLFKWVNARFYEFLPFDDEFILGKSTQKYMRDEDGTVKKVD